MVDYYIIRKQKLKLTHLYVDSEDSIYWFYRGYNIRAIVCWILAVCPVMRECSSMLVFGHTEG